MKTYTLKIVAIRKETDDAKTICFKQPALKKVSYQAGQYLTLVLSINNRKYRRPYSFSSSPGIDPTLDITVKRVPKGVVSNHLIDVIKEGDLIEVLEPMGEFIYSNTSHIMLWGVGSGITPLMSILKFALNDNNDTKITLTYGNRNLEQTIFYEQLNSLKRQYSDRFSLFLFYSKADPTQTSVANGRLDKEQMQEIVNKSNCSKETLHYICGPEGLKKSIKLVLLENGINSANILSEDFTHTVNEAELGNIHTRPVQLSQGGEMFSLEVVRGKSILEAGLDYGLDLPYSCQTGSCTLCKAKLLTGKVKVLRTVKPDIELEKDDFLLCCSYPLTENVSFEIQ